MTRTFLRLAPACLLATVLAGCSDSDVKEIDNWMDETNRATRVKVDPISEPKTFLPFAYNLREEIDPFDPSKLLTELARAAAADGDKFRPDTSRRKEPLEAFPLDTMRMVGTLKSKGVNYGLLQIDRTVHRVRIGEHVGQNFGKITSVNDDAIGIKETVQDAGGEWVERATKLELQEGKESGK